MCVYIYIYYIYILYIYMLYIYAYTDIYIYIYVYIYIYIYIYIYMPVYAFLYIKHTCTQNMRVSRIPEGLQNSSVGHVMWVVPGCIPILELGETYWWYGRLSIASHGHKTNHCYNSAQLFKLSQSVAHGTVLVAL